MKSAPDMETMRQAAAFSSWVSWQASTITFRMWPPQEALTARISARTPSQSVRLCKAQIHDHVDLVRAIADGVLRLKDLDLGVA